jgi:hypothetical protein
MGEENNRRKVGQVRRNHKHTFIKPYSYLEYSLHTVSIKCISHMKKEIATALTLSTLPFA